VRDVFVCVWWWEGGARLCPAVFPTPFHAHQPLPNALRHPLFLPFLPPSFHQPCTTNTHTTLTNTPPTHHTNTNTNTPQPGLRAALKATHLHPGRPQAYCNLAILLEDFAMATFKRVLAKETKTAADARRAEQVGFFFGRGGLGFCGRWAWGMAQHRQGVVSGGGGGLVYIHPPTTTMTYYKQINPRTHTHTYTHIHLRLCRTSTRPLRCTRGGRRCRPTPKRGSECFLFSFLLCVIHFGCCLCGVGLGCFVLIFMWWGGGGGRKEIRERRSFSNTLLSHSHRNEKEPKPITQ
jgi:hypothetical protein